MIEALIAEFDVLAKQDTVVLKAAPYAEPKQDTPAENTVTQIIKLQCTDCEKLAEKLKLLLYDEQFRIVPDKRTNTLLVNGPESVIKKIKALVAEIDVPGLDTNTEVIDPKKQEQVDLE